MSIVPKVEGTVESGEVDPSKMSHADIKDLATKYQEAVAHVAEQQLLLVEASQIIIQLQAALRKLRGEQDETKDDQRDHHKANEGVVGDH